MAYFAHGVKRHLHPPQQGLARLSHSDECASFSFTAVRALTAMFSLPSVYSLWPYVGHPLPGFSWKCIIFEEEYEYCPVPKSEIDLCTPLDPHCSFLISTDLTFSCTRNQKLSKLKFHYLTLEV